MTTAAAALAALLALAQPALDDVIVTGSVDSARALLAQGADVNQKDQDGVTPLMRAASAGRGDMVRLLLASGADASAASTGGVTALMMASLGGYLDAIGPLLKAKGGAAGVNNVNARDGQGRTALMAAASSGDAAAVAALLDAGADASAADKTGGTAMTYASAEGHAAVVTALQKRGAKAGEMEMLLAANRCNTPIVRAFIDGGMRVNTAESRTPPLVVAAGGGCTEVVDLLLARGADVNAKNADGATALIKAASAGHADVARRLLARGADMSLADSLGRTAWMYAAMAGREELGIMFRQARAAQPPAKIDVSSSALKAGETMGREYTADGHNISPPLAWSTAPNGTRSLAVVCEDPDAGNPPPFVHWVIYNIPGEATGLPENVPFEAGARMPASIEGAIQGVSGFRRPFYRGPAPPPGKPHHYHFVVYALDIDGLDPGLTRADLLGAINGHVLGQGELVAIYERKP